MLLAPDQSILDAYKKRGEMPWSQYEARFFELMRTRRVEQQLSRESFRAATALLCSEATPEHCHRRLVIEYLAQHWPEVRAVHL